MEEFEVIQLWIPYVCGGYDHCVRIPTRTTQKLGPEERGTGSYRRGREQKNKKGLILKFFQMVQMSQKIPQSVVKIWSKNLKRGVI
jgi:hypothetical protein